MDPKNLKRPISYLTRKQQISCCHRLNSPFLSKEENALIYGKCNNVWGHGHNYTVEVTVRGPVHPLTGMVMDLNDLKNYIRKVVMDQMDHKNIDKQGRIRLKFVSHLFNRVYNYTDLNLYICLLIYIYIYILIHLYS
ncbi:6-pyruvoyl tetrahydrobiopterin synthase isoform X2 [Linepithema humile]|uniref:6-pyruvoyl tetrahydrobiopterin synthase isoform X2 n=1 Tax=Linepithema humile TaxID=83485 RepID=UPI0006231150|nr:PREDICTED: 6-pyruvoyl tetrahydrobiopterin synthase isoform X2 [Linepithema humile]